MEEKDLSQNPDLELKISEKDIPNSQESEPEIECDDEVVKSLYNDAMEFSEFDLIQKIYYLMISREALKKLSENTLNESNKETYELKIFIDKYVKSTYSIIRNYVQKKNLSKINKDIDESAQSIMTLGHVASETYHTEILFSEISFEMLKVFLITTIVLHQVRSSDSRHLYNDIKTIRSSSKTKEITTNFNNQLMDEVYQVLHSTVDQYYSLVALKKSERTFNEYNRTDIPLNFMNLVVEQIIDIPYTEENTDIPNFEKEDKIYIKIDNDYQKYYKEKINQLIERFLSNDITQETATKLFVPFEVYLTCAAQFIKHDQREVGMFIALTIADKCSRTFKQLKSEDFGEIPYLGKVFSRIINNALTLLFSVGNDLDKHELKKELDKIVETFKVPEEHYMGETDLNLYLKAWSVVISYGKENLFNYITRHL